MIDTVRKSDKTFPSMEGFSIGLSKEHGRDSLVEIEDHGRNENLIIATE